MQRYTNTHNAYVRFKDFDHKWTYNFFFRSPRAVVHIFFSHYRIDSKMLPKKINLFIFYFYFLFELFFLVFEHFCVAFERAKRKDIKSIEIVATFLLNFFFPRFFLSPLNFLKTLAFIQNVLLWLVEAAKLSTHKALWTAYDQGITGHL